AEVGEGEVGRSPTDGILRGAGDAELRGDVLAVGEERRVLVDAAAEIPRQVAVESRLEAVAPARGGIHAGAFGAIAETEQRGIVAGAHLVVEAEIEPVFAAK